MAAELGALIAELDGTVGVRSPERHSEILRAVSSLFFTKAKGLAEAQIDIFDNILVRLIDGTDRATLVQLSKSLALARLAPRETVRQLALHEDASIAVPILERSDRLSESDLVRIAGTGSEQHLLAISKRTAIGKPVGDALVHRGSSAVCRSLADNLGAQFSETSVAVLMKTAERDLGLAQRLRRRSDIPPEARRKLQAILENARLRDLLDILPSIQQRIQESIATPTAARRPRPTDYAQARAKMADLNRTGKLSDSVVNWFAVGGEYTEVVAALSFLTGARIEVIEPLVGGGDLEGLVVACKAARLSWATAKMIIYNRPGSTPASDGELNRARGTFDSLSLSAAQRTIRLELSSPKGR